MTIEPADERILRAKYLDWCSARVADRFLELTPDQIYELAHLPTRRGSTRGAVAVAADAPDGGGAGVAHQPDADTAPSSFAGGGDEAVGGVEGSGVERGGAERGGAERGGAEQGGVEQGGVEAPLDYAALVARATEALAAHLALPAFEDWVVAYEREPEQYERELLGLWKRKA